MLYFQKIVRSLTKFVSKFMGAGVICPYCGKEAILVDSQEVYSVSYGMIWLCRPCNAYVGCHENSDTHKPKGRLANKELRQWRIKAHELFDPLWKKKMVRDGCSKSVARKAGYKWLAGELGIPPSECHISWLSLEMCKRAVEICQNLKKAKS